MSDKKPSPPRKKYRSHPRKVGAYTVLEVESDSERSTIYLAVDDEEQQIWLLALPKNVDHEYVLQFKRRMETLLHLNHIGLPEIQDNRTRKNSHAFATFHHQPLSSLSRQFHMDEDETDPLPPERALELIRKIAEVLAVMHPAGLVHTDLQPDRIFFDQDENPLFLDAAVPFIPSANKHEGENITRLPYASPEEREGKSITARSNIYSLGVILYQLLAGHQPRLPVSEWDIFEYKALPREVPLEDARAGLTTETYDLVRNCLWQKEWSRYETMEQLIAAIEIAGAAEEIGPPPPPDFFTKNKTWFLVGVPVLLFLLVLLYFLLL